MPSKAKRLTGRKILVVEDEYFLAQDIAANLEEEGAEVVGPCAFLDDALAAVASEQPDLVTLDINLRGELTYPVAEELKARGVPFVFATVYVPNAIKPAWRHVPVWSKLFPMDDLVSMLMVAHPA